MEAQIRDIFAAGGPLGATLERYAPRAEQLEMAQAVARAIANARDLVVEAGTGTGKTFAYLVPALLSGRRVAISTGTRALQDQLFRRDLPALSRALGLPVEVALLKGRSNYLCLHRLRLAEGASPEEAAQLQRIRDWRWSTHSGDIAGVEGVPEDAAIWPRVTSTSDNCLGSRCADFADCLVARARREAVRADVVVVNHHLLLADLALRDEGFGEVLPHVDAVIVDEAHQLPAIAAQQFGRVLGAAQLTRWLDDYAALAQREGFATARLQSLTAAMQAALQAVRHLLGATARRLAWSTLAAPDAARAAARLEEVLEGMHQLAEDATALEEHAGPDAEPFVRRARESCRFLEEFLQPAEPSAAAAGQEGTAGEGGLLRWADVHRQSFSLHMTPVESATALSAAMATRECTWVFTSATLAVDGDFSHFIERAGLAGTDVDTLLLHSPFDYAANGLLYLPDGLPDPGAADYVACVCAAALPLVLANPGGTFLLFTSYRALEAARRWFDGRVDRLLLAQGDAPRSLLLERFRVDGRAVLLGTSSFWEGVDVRGPALSLVVIDKLPFASPGEPLLRARLDWLEEQGRSGFRDQLLPAAVIALKQGVGRLIRDHGDRGVLMLCDPRLRTRAYGRRFLRSLPPMPLTHDAVAAQAFLADDGVVAGSASGPASAAGGGVGAESAGAESAGAAPGVAGTNRGVASALADGAPPGRTARGDG